MSSKGSQAKKQTLSFEREPDEDVDFQEIHHTAHKVEVVDIVTDDDDVVDITDEIKDNEVRQKRRNSIRQTRAGKQHMKGQEFERAKREFQMSIEGGSMNYGNYYYKSQAEYYLNNLQQACEDARAAIILAPGNNSTVKYKCHAWLLQIKLSMGEIKCCEKLISNIRRLFRGMLDNDESLETIQFKKLVEDFRKLSEYVTALKSAESSNQILHISVEAVKIGYKCASLFLGMAKSYIETAKYLEARSACVSALTYGGDSILANYYQFQSLFLSGCLKEAKRILDVINQKYMHEEIDPIFETLSDGMNALLKEGETVKKFSKERNYGGVELCLLNSQKIIQSSPLLKNEILESEIAAALQMLVDYKEQLTKDACWKQVPPQLAERLQILYGV